MATPGAGLTNMQTVPDAAVYSRNRAGSDRSRITKPTIKPSTNPIGNSTPIPMQTSPNCKSGPAANIHMVAGASVMPTPHHSARRRR